MNHLKHYSPTLLGRNYVLPQATGLKGLYLDWFGVPDVRLQLSTLYLYQTLSELQFGSLLDVGCGSGVMTNLIASVYPHCPILGIDRDEDGIEYAKGQAAQNGLRQTRFQALDIESDFPKGKYDAITCMAVLQFIRDTQALLKKFYDALTVGGHLVIQVPVVNDLRFLMRLPKAQNRMPDFHEAREAFTEAEIRSLLVQNGFEITQIRQIIKGPTVMAKELFYLLLSAHPKAPFLLCPILNRITALDEMHSGEGQGLLVVARKPDLGST
jgi:2-polyprenyl-3-methyl-5-hydroxy-6-metoxy-1,4-benzoquinol methylase